jgi:hypothetical protein
MTVIRLLTYGVLVFGSFYLERRYAFFDQFSFPDLVICGSLFAAYMALLCLEVRACVHRGASQWRTGWAGYGFTAGVGVIWAFVISTHRGTFPMLEGPGVFLGFVVSFVVFSAMFGVLGMALSLLILKFVFGKEVH